MTADIDLLSTLMSVRVKLTRGATIQQQQNTFEVFVFSL